MRSSRSNQSTRDNRSALTKAEQRRKSELIQELARLSRNGWANAHPSDYRDLEVELRLLEIKEYDDA